MFVPASVHYAKNEYFSVNGPKVASISVNIFVADYQQRTRTLDLTEDMARKGFTTVNTVEWSIESRRLAAVLVVPAIWIIVRIVRRASTNA